MRKGSKKQAEPIFQEWITDYIAEQVTDTNFNFSVTTNNGEFDVPCNQVIAHVLATPEWQQDELKRNLIKARLQIFAQGGSNAIG